MRGVGGLGRARSLAAGAAAQPLKPLGQRVAVARDVAFAFAYPALLEGWRSVGAALQFFSPLADEAPDATADAVYLPVRNPALHAAALPRNGRYLDGRRAAAKRGSTASAACGSSIV